MLDNNHDLHGAAQRKEIHISALVSHPRRSADVQPDEPRGSYPLQISPTPVRPPRY